MRFYFVLTSTNKKYSCRKTRRGHKFNVKGESIRRSKILNFNQQLMNIWLKKGYKLNFIKHYNLFLENFRWLLIHEFNTFEKLPYYKYILELLNTKYYYYQFENLLEESFKELEYIFDLKFKKLSKSEQKSLEKKYDYRVCYIYKNKRFRYTIQLLYSNVNSYKYTKYSSRMYDLFIDFVLNPKSLEIWERKLNVYKLVYKRLNSNK